MILSLEMRRNAFVVDLAAKHPFILLPDHSFIRLGWNLMAMFSPYQEERKSIHIALIPLEQKNLYGMFKIPYMKISEDQWAPSLQNYRYHRGPSEQWSIRTFNIGHI